MSNIYQPGDMVGGRYRIVRALSKGGMGAVYLARQVSLDRDVALKVIHCAGGATLEDRFDMEARGVCRLKHPNVITYHDYGRDERGRLYLVMEFLEGYPGTALINDPELRPSPEGISHIVSQLCSALQASHAVGVVHRDLKWSNVMVVPQAHDALYVKLIDFGILKLAPSPSAPQRPEAELTRTGMLLGTPQYMSPEAICGRPVDGRSDLYALAVMTYELICGRRPFDHSDRLALLTAQVQESPRPLCEVGPSWVSAPLEAALSRGMAKLPSARFADAEAFRSAVTAAISAASAEGGRRVAVSTTRGVATAPTAPQPQPQPPASTPISTTPVTSEPLRAAPAKTGRRTLWLAGAVGAAAAGLLAMVIAPSSHDVDLPRPSAPTSAHDHAPAKVSVATPSPNVPKPVAQRAPRPVDIAPPPSADEARPASEVTADPSHPPKAARGATGASARSTAALRRSATTGYLTVVAKPYAAITVNGKHVGDSPIRRLKLPSGRATVQLSSAHAQSRTRRVTIKKGEVTTLIVDMQK